MMDPRAFMQSLFEARCEEARRHQEAQIPYRRKFFSETCKYDDQPEALRWLAEERIIEVACSGNTVEVVTEQEMPFNAMTRHLRWKFMLIARGDSWVVKEVLMGCVFCEGRGDPDCLLCHGDPWRSRGNKGSKPTEEP